MPPAKRDRTKLCEWITRNSAEKADINMQYKLQSIFNEILRYSVVSKYHKFYKQNKYLKCIKQ